MLHTLRATNEALAAVREASERLNTTLEETNQTNKDTRRWRRIASVAIAIVGGLLLAFMWQTREDAEARDREADEQVLVLCQDRNAAQRYSRENIGQAQVDALRSTADDGEALPVVDILQSVIDNAPPDTDCDGDGELTTADYPPEPVGR